MKLRKSAFCLLSVCALALPVMGACGNTPATTSNSAASNNTTTSAAPVTSSETPVTSASQTTSAKSSSIYDSAWVNALPDCDVTADDVKDVTAATTVKASIMYDKNTHIKFLGIKDEKLPYAAANGKTYNSGDFKPVWEALQDKDHLNFTIVDNTPSGASISDSYKSLRDDATNGTFGTINVGQGNSDDIISDGTTSAASTTGATILDLHKYMKAMPNFTDFLAKNPSIRRGIQDANGAIYYAPYFDGFDDLERMLSIRHDIVEKLLDGDYAEATFDTATKITAAYERFGADTVDEKIDVVVDGKKTQVAKKYAADGNIIDIQNNLASLDGAKLVKALRDYIDKTYSNFYGTKRSELFVGDKAAYDIDELVALYRCVKANPALLTGNASAKVAPLYTRAATNDRTSTLWNFMQFFGCRGMESRNGFLYVGADGRLVDARTDSKTIKALGRMNAMYSEGLILQDFDTAGAVKTGSENFYTDLVDNKDYLGFSMYDYCQVPTSVDTATYPLVPTLPAVADWRNDGVQFHFTESWRSVKTNGWFITAATAKDPAVLKRCLRMFDYFWSAEGVQLMSYGPDAWIAHDTSNKVVTTEYMGKQVPKLSDAALSELSTQAGGNYTKYYRYWLGGTFPVGYIKEQGMEYQCVSTIAQPYLLKVENAIALGVLQHPNFATDNSDNLYTIMPTTVAFTSDEQASLKNYTQLNNYFNTQKKYTNIFTYIVKNGWDGAAALKTDVTPQAAWTDAAGYKDYVITATTGLGEADWMSIYQIAYARMGL
jgi:hypothetical protein